jgi:hypothetical protein
MVVLMVQALVVVQLFAVDERGREADAMTAENEPVCIHSTTKNAKPMLPELPQRPPNHFKNAVDTRIEPQEFKHKNQTTTPAKPRARSGFMPLHRANSPPPALTYPPLLPDPRQTLRLITQPQSDGVA